MVHIPPIYGSHHAGHLGDSGFQAAINALTQANKDMAQLFSIDNTGTPTGLLSNLLMEIAESSGSGAQITSLFNAIYGSLQNVLNDLNNPALNNLYVSESGFGGSLLLYMNDNKEGSTSPSLYDMLQQLQTAFGNPEGTPPGGLFEELQASNYEPTPETLSFLSTLIEPFQVGAYNAPLDPTEYPSTWTSAEQNLYTAFWGAAGDLPVQYGQPGNFTNLLTPFGAIGYALWAVENQNNGNPNACSMGTFPCAGFGPIPPPSNSSSFNNPFPTQPPKDIY